MPSNDTAIYDATILCRNSLAECVKVDRLMENRWAALRLADFNLWAAGIGASAAHKASLDARLSLRPDVRDVVVKILQILKSTVDTCKELAVDKILAIERDDDGDLSGTTSLDDRVDRAFSPWPDESNSESEAELSSSPTERITRSFAATRTVDVVLSQLARIAVAIRRSGTRSRLQKADSSFEPKNYKGLEDHLRAVVLRRPGALLTAGDCLLTDSNKPQPTGIQQRLIQANLRRRHRFIYAQRHAEKLERAGPYPRPTESTAVVIMLPKEEQRGAQSNPTPGEVSSATPQESNKLNVTAQTVARSSKGSEQTGTTASAPSESLALPENQTPSQSAPTRVSSTATKIDYPWPPPAENGALFFRCPCCCQSLPDMIGRGNRWKKHIAEDVYPYTCILPECAKEDVLYITKEAWKTHLMEDHQSAVYWVCLVCNADLKFPTEEVLISHIRQQHRESILEDQISLLAPMSKRSAPVDITACPLCDSWPPKELGKVDTETMIDHIAEEVHSFSLRALPWAPDDDEAGHEERVDHAAQKVQQWLLQVGLTQPDAKERPPYSSQKPPLDNSHYFKRHPYFAEVGGDDSPNRGDSDDSAASHLQSLRDEGPLRFVDSKDDVNAEEGHLGANSSFDLAEHLDSRMVTMTFRGHIQKFIPKAAFDVATTRKAILEAISRDISCFLSSSDLDDFVSKLHQDGRKLFVVCVYCEIPLKLLKTLLHKGLTDKDLPISAVQFANILDTRVFSRSFRNSFIECQKYFRTAFFELGSFQTLDYNISIPIDLEEAPHNLLGRGAFGEVWKVKIYQDYHDFAWGTNSSNEFAMKVTRDDIQPGIFADITRRLVHPHLTACLAAFSLGNKLHRIYELARCNLEEFMSHAPVPSTTMEETAFIKQLRGLTEALDAVHNQAEEFVQPGTLSVPQFGPNRTDYAHAIKPSSMLVFMDSEQVPCFRLSDHSSQRVIDLIASTRDNRHTHKHPNKIKGSVYRAPESRRGTTGRPSNVWSLGCVFMELLVWFLYGYGALETFREERRREVVPGGIEDEGFYFQEDESIEEYQLRPPVTAMLERLSTQTGGILREIVNLTLEMLEIGPESRITTARLVEQLKTLDTGLDSPTASDFDFSDIVTVTKPSDD